VHKTGAQAQEQDRQQELLAQGIALGFHHQGLDVGRQGGQELLSLLGHQKANLPGGQKPGNMAAKGSHVAANPKVRELACIQDQIHHALAF
jgi:putative NIF3 family GTP cyclohydrolase 1 type 2